MPTIDDIRDAATRLRDVACITPLLESTAINARTGGRVLLKCEMFQPMGAFKIRGAWNRISRLPDRERARGIVTHSSGNHAQAAALAAQRLGIDATIVMPSDAPDIKIERTRSFGANIVTCSREGSAREQVAAEIMDRTGAVLIHPYDHPDVVAGQGTVGLEVVAQCRELDIDVDIAVVPCSGGGLIAGTALALHASWPDAEIHAAEPDGFDDTRRSLLSGKRETNAPGATSICDALLVSTPGELTFDINRKHLAGAASVSDSEVRAAMKTAFSDARLVTEPGGATGLAAILAGKIDIVGKTACVILSGGNVDPDLFADIISGPGSVNRESA